MENLISLLVVIIAFEHLYFLVLEMFLWTHPKGLKVFGQTLEQAQASAKLAKNQGLYNGFLAAGLLWSLVHPSPDFSYELRLFFLDCVILAGVYGALTANKKIFFIQALPAIVTLALVVLRG